MLRRKIMLVTLLTGVGVAVAQDAARTQTAVDALSAELSSRMAVLQRSPAVQALVAAVDRARAEYEAAERNLPGMAALDAQMQALMNQLHAVQAQRADLLRKHEPELSVKRAVVEEAEAAQSAALFGVARVKELLAGRQELVRQLEAAQPAPAPQPAEVAP